MTEFIDCLWPLEEDFLKAFPPKSFFFILMFKDLLFSVKPAECTYTPLHTQKQSLQKIGRIQLYGSYDRCVLIEMGRLMITNFSCLITVIMLDRKGKEGREKRKA